MAGDGYLKLSPLRKVLLGVQVLIWAEAFIRRNTIVHCSHRKGALIAKL